MKLKSGDEPPTVKELGLATSVVIIVAAVVMTLFKLGSVIFG